MFNTFLVPLDGTPGAASVLPFAQTLAAATLSHLALLRVVPTGDEAAVAAARADLTKLAGALTTEELRVSTLVRQGDVAEQILEVARSPQIDLVIMATRGRSGLPRAVFGSVAERVLAESPTPVLLERVDAPVRGRLRSILVPVDGSPGSAIALGAAAGLARSTGARLTLLQAVVPIPVHLYAHPFPAVLLNAHVDPGWDEERQAAAKRYVDGLAARLREEGLVADSRIGVGGAAATIVETAGAVAADVIVMSTHALTGITRALLGSVADEVVRAADRPVLLLRQPDAAHAGATTRGAATQPLHHTVAASAAQAAIELRNA